MSSTDTDEEETPNGAAFHLKGQVLPSITLPGASSEESDGGDTSDSESEIVFSSINWATSPMSAQQARAEEPRPALQPAGVPPTSPQVKRSPTKFNVWKPGSSIPAPAAPEAPHPSSKPTLAHDDSSPSEHSPVNSPRSPAIAITGKYSAVLKAAGGHSPTPCSPVSGNNTWLSGAAGRLSDLATPRSQLRESMQLEVCKGLNALTQGAEPAVVEEAALHHFNTTLEQDAQEPVAAGSCLKLEDDVAGIALDDLDQLIARLQAGGLVLDLNATRPAHLPDPSTLFTDSDDDDELPASGLIKAGRDEHVPHSTRAPHTTHQPAAPAAARPAPAAAPPLSVASHPTAPSAVAKLDVVHGKDGVMGTAVHQPREGVPVAPKPPAPPAQDQQATTTGTALPARPIVGSQPAGPMVQPMNMNMDQLPPRFRMWAQTPPGSGLAPPPAADLPSSSLQSKGAADARRTVVVDLRQGISQLQSASTKPTVQPEQPVPTQQAVPTHSIAIGNDQPMNSTRSTFVGTDNNNNNNSSSSTGPAGSTDGNSTAVSRPAGLIGSRNPAGPKTKSTFVGGCPVPSDPSHAMPASAPVINCAAVGSNSSSSSAAPTSTSNSSATAQTNAQQPASKVPSKVDAPATPAPPVTMRAAQVDTEGLLPPAGPSLASSGISRWSAQEQGPGVAQEEGSRVVTAGMRIRLPAGPPIQVPEAVTKADACTGGDSPIALDGRPEPDGTGLDVAAAKPDARVPKAKGSVSTTGAGKVEAQGSKGSATTAVQPTVAPNLPVAASTVASVLVGGSTRQAQIQAGVTQAARQSGGENAAARPASLPTALSLPCLPDHSPKGHSFTCVITSPDNLTTPTVAVVLQWLLSALVQGEAGRKLPTLDDSSVSKPPAFSVQGFKLLQLPANHSLIQGLPGQTAQHPACVQLKPAVTAAAPAHVRALVVACDIPQQIGPDGLDVAVVMSDQRKPPTSDQDVLTCTLKRFRGWLKGKSWASISQASGQASMPTPAATASSLTDWIDCTEGSDLLASLDNRPIQVPSTAKTLVTPGQPGAASSPSDVFVTVLPQAALSSPCVLGSVLARASAAGLAVLGMTSVYADAQTAAYFHSRTPHKLLADVPAVAVALSGHQDALQRWRSEISSICSALPGLMHTQAAGTPPAQHVSHLLTCSFDTKGAAVEAALMFGAEDSVAASQEQSKEAMVGMVSAAGSGIRLLAQPGSQTRLMLALPASTTSETLAAVQTIAQIAAAGLPVGSMLRVRTPPGLHFTWLHGCSSSASTEPGLSIDSSAVLAVQVQGLECVKQLQLCLQHIAQCASSDSGIASIKQAGARDSNKSLPAETAALSSGGLWVAGLDDSSAASWQLHLAKVAGKLPAAHETQAMVSAVQQAASTDDGDGVSKVQIVSPDNHHLDPHEAGQDQLVAVYINGGTQSALVVTQAILHACTSLGAATPDYQQEQLPGSCQVELVAIRTVQHNPPASLTQLLHPCRSIFGPSSCDERAGHVGSRPASASSTVSGSKPAALPGAAGVMLVLHGPDARQLITASLAHAADVASSATNANRTGRWSGSGVELPAELQSVLSRLVKQHVGSTAGHVGHVTVSLSANHQDACKLMATCFAEDTQVHLDLSFHNGVTRPSVPFTSSAILHLASSPHVHDTFVAAPLQLPGRPAADGKAALAALYRAIKVLHKSGCVLAAAKTLPQLPQTLAVSCLHKPDLQGQPVALLWLRCNNAVHRVQKSLHHAGLEGKLAAAPSWQAAQQLIQLVWTKPTENSSSSSPVAAPSSPLPTTTQLPTELSAQNTTCLVLLPPVWQPVTASARGTRDTDAVSKVYVDLGLASDVLGVAVGAGFTLAACHASRLATDLVVATAKTCQVLDLNTGRPAGIPAKGWGTAQPASLGACPPAGAAGGDADCLVLVLQRPNAVAQLQLCMEQYAAGIAKDAQPGVQAGGALLAIACSNHQNDLLDKAGVPVKLV